MDFTLTVYRELLTTLLEGGFGYNGGLTSLCRGRADLSYIQEELNDRTHITSSVDEGYFISNSRITDYLNCGGLSKTLYKNGT